MKGIKDKNFLVKNSVKLRVKTSLGEELILIGAGDIRELNYYPCPICKKKVMLIPDSICGECSGNKLWRRLNNEK